MKEDHRVTSVMVHGLADQVGEMGALIVELSDAHQYAKPMRTPGGYFYIMVNHKSGTIYVGSTNDLRHRNAEHKNATNPDSFTAKYDCKVLVYFETYDTLSEARARERAVKRYKRSWKIVLIERDNPEWEDIPLRWDD